MINNVRMSIVYKLFCGHMFSIIWLFGKEIYCWKPFEKQPNSPAEQLDFCIFLSAVCESSNFSQSVKLVIVHLSEDNHPTWELMIHCGLGLHFPETMMMIIFFPIWLLVNCASSLETFLLKFFSYLLKLLFKDFKKKHCIWFYSSHIYWLMFSRKNLCG